MEIDLSINNEIITTIDIENVEPSNAKQIKQTIFDRLKIKRNTEESCNYNIFSDVSDRKFFNIKRK